jgi:hypothetical protein
VQSEKAWGIPTEILTDGPRLFPATFLREAAELTVRDAAPPTHAKPSNRNGARR